MKSRSPVAPPAHPRRRLTALAVYSVALLVVIAGCGPSPKVEPDLVSKVGVVILAQTEGAAAPEGQATFVELTEARAKDLLEGSLSPAVGTCIVGALGAAATGAVAPAPGGARLNVANGALRVDGLPYGELRPTDAGAYGLVGATAPLPASGLTLTVPAGATYGGVDSLTVSTGSQPALAAGFDASTISLDTEFLWEAGSGAATLLLFGAGSGVTFSCFADDAAGSFEFPEATRGELSAAGFTTGELNLLGRLTTTTATVGDSDLLLVGALRISTLGGDL